MPAPPPVAVKVDPFSISRLPVSANASSPSRTEPLVKKRPMPDPELHYFSRYYDRGDEWYLEHFAGQEHRRLRGEKSNSYMSIPGICAIAIALPGSFEESTIVCRPECVCIASSRRFV